MPSQVAGKRVAHGDQYTPQVTERPCTVLRVSSDDPYVQLPDHIELSLAEAGAVLEVLDIAAAAGRSEDELMAVAEVARMITAKLWPEFGDLLDGDEA